MEPTSIGGAWTYSPVVHRDDRGHFLDGSLFPIYRE